MEPEMAKCEENKNFPKISDDVWLLSCYLKYELYAKYMLSVGSAVQCMREIAHFEFI